MYQNYGRKWHKKRIFRLFSNLRFFTILEGFRKQFLFSFVWRFSGAFWELPSHFRNETALVDYAFSRGRIVVNVQQTLKKLFFSLFFGLRGTKNLHSTPVWGWEHWKEKLKINPNFQFFQKKFKTAPENILGLPRPLESSKMPPKSKIWIWDPKNVVFGQLTDTCRIFYGRRIFYGVRKFFHDLGSSSRITG